MPLSTSQKIELLERQKLKCPHCGRTITLDANRLRDWIKILGHPPDPSVPSKAYFHHLKWRSKGGTDNLANYVATCGRGHAKAHDFYRKYK